MGGNAIPKYETDDVSESGARVRVAQDRVASEKRRAGNHRETGVMLALAHDVTTVAIAVGIMLGMSKSGGGSYNWNGLGSFD